MTTQSTTMTIGQSLQETAVYRDFGSVLLPADWQVQRRASGALRVRPSNTRAVVLDFDGRFETTPNAARRLERFASMPSWTIREYEDGRRIAWDDGVLSDDILTKTWLLAVDDIVVQISAHVAYSRRNDSPVQTALAEIDRVAESIRFSDRDIELLDPTAEAETPPVDPWEIDEVEEEVDAASRSAFQEFTLHDRRMLDVCLRHFDEQAEKHDESDADDAGRLDRVATAWLDDPERPMSDHRLIGAIGAAFGRELVERHGFVWRRVGQSGDKIVLHEATGVCVWPFDFAIQKVSLDSPDFLASMLGKIVDGVRPLRKAR